MLILQVKSSPYSPDNPHVEERAQKELISKLSQLSEGTIIIAQVYANPVIGFENRLLFVAEKFDRKSNKIALAGIPYASVINGTRYSGLSAGKVSPNDITDLKVLETDEKVKIKTRDGEAVEGSVHKANFVRDRVFIGKNAVAKLELELISGPKEKMVKHVVQFADIESIERNGAQPAKIEIFPAYNL